MPKKVPKKVRKNFLFPKDIDLWARTFARRNNTTMTKMLLDYLYSLKEQVETGYANQI